MNSIHFTPTKCLLLHLPLPWVLLVTTQKLHYHKMVSYIYFWCILFCFSLHIILVPSSGPENVWGTSLSPYNIELHWDPPSTETQNGDIVFYHINITHISSRKVQVVEVPGNSSFYSRHDFHPYYTYICTVHAVTIGAGPGTSVIITTKETGTMVCMHYS